MDSVKEVLDSENDPDTNPIEDYPAVEASTKVNIVSDETITVTEETGLNDKQLADEFGVNPSMVKRWRTGTSKPRGNNLKRLKQWEIRQNRWYKIKL